MIEVEIPVHIEPLNSSWTDSWRTRPARNTSHRAATWFALKGAKIAPVLPCVVTLTRIAPRRLDVHDNLAGGFRSCVDAIADWLGVDDADPRVSWRYEQAKGKPKQYAARVRIEAK